jgi:tetratricopeptide (TPR) repeat protein
MSTVPAPNYSGGSFRVTGLACAVIVLCALAVYHNSFSGPFIFDDAWSIKTNPSIHRLGSALSPPPERGVGGRPILNLTFAINYALAGLDVRGYHALNLLIHALAGLTLFGIVRRTLTSRLATRRSEISNLRFEMSEATQMRGEGTPPTVLALAVAVIWVVHPLQTEAVTYISQRAESLMGLFYLLTLYCFIRSVENGRSGFRPDTSGINPDLQSNRGSLPNSVFQLFSPSAFWMLASVLSCLLGVLSKEIIVTAPVMVMLYDRTFVAGSFREAWRLRWRYYLGLAGTWLLLARLMMNLRERGIGFEQGVAWWSYALTSCRSVVLYLKLAVWPHPLVLDYGIDVVQHATEAVPYALILAGLVAATLVALWRRPAMGFAGAWFFIILAPASSVVPVTGQPMAEHRMYLSLAAVVAGGVFGLYAWIGRRSLIVFVAAVMGLGWLGIQRNKDYRSAWAIWSDTIAKCPGNPRAYSNLGDALMDIPGQKSEAIAAYETALQIKPDLPTAHNDLGCALADTPGGVPAAIGHFKAAIWFNQNYAIAHNNLGVTWYKTGRFPEAIIQFEEAVKIKPDYAEAHYNLGLAWYKVGRVPEAIFQLEEAVRIDPDYAEAHFNLGTSLAQNGQIPEAIDQLEEAVRIKPDYVEAHRNLGIALSQAGRIPEAIAQCEEVLRIKPDAADTRAFMEKLRKAGR